MLPFSIPSPDPDWQILVNLGQVLRDIGWTSFPFDINIHAYAVCILLGIVVATAVANARLKRRGAEPGVILDIALFAVIGGIIGSRLYHVVTHPGDYFFVEGRGPLDTLIEIVAVWNGGVAIFGALIGGAVGVWLACRFTGLRFWSALDAIAPVMLIAQAFGRLGNYINQELFGLPTDLPWGLEVDPGNATIPNGLPDGTLFHPTFLYEIIWMLVGFALILLIERKVTLQWGKVLALYLIWYGLGRSWFESIRLDPSELFLGVRTNVWAAVLAVIVGIVLLIVQTRRHPGLEPSPYKPGREWSPEAEVESADTYSDSDDPDDSVDGDDAAIETEKPATSGASVTR